MLDLPSSALLQSRYNLKMPLPILKSSYSASSIDLVRFAHQMELEWSRHLAEETVLDSGVALVNGELASVFDANRMMNAGLIPGTDPAATFTEVEAHFAARKSLCWRWLMNPSLPAERTAPLVAYLLGNGFRSERADILHLPHLPQKPVEMRRDLQIIPARASFKHYRELAEESAAQWKAPALVEAAMLHLDDPRFESVLALKDGRAVGAAGVQIVGEIGSIQRVFVSRDFRQQGVGRTLMARVLEICVRSLLRHILLCVASDNEPAIALYRSLGFENVGEMISYDRMDQPRP